MDIQHVLSDERFTNEFIFQELLDKAEGGSLGLLALAYAHGYSAGREDIETPQA